MGIVRGVCDAFRQSTGTRRATSTRFAGLGLSSECLEAKICLTADVIAGADVFSAQTEDIVQEIPSLPGGLLANDTVDGASFNGSNLVVTDVPGGSVVDDGFVVTSALGADVLVRPDGSFIYNPLGSETLQALGPGEGATDSFSYTVSDAGGMDSETATVTFSITGIDDAPEAVADTAVAVIGDATVVEIDVLANDSDPEGEELTLVDPGVTITTALGGEVTFDSGTGIASYTAPATGTPGDVDTFTYTVSDSADNGVAITNTAIVSVTLGEPPLAQADALTTDQNTDLSADAASGLLSNDFLGDMPDDVEITEISVDADFGDDDPPASLVGETLDLVAGGTLTINPDGSFDFVVGDDFLSLAEGATVAIPVTYTITDSDSGRTSTTTATFTVTGLNDAPSGAAFTFNVAEDTVESINVIDEAVTDIDNGDVLTVTNPFTDMPFETFGGTSASITLEADGTLTVTPTEENGSGVVGSVTVLVEDAAGVQTSFSVAVVIDAVNDPPVAENGDNEFTFTEGVFPSAFLDADDAEGDVLTFILISDATNGEVTIVDDSTGEFLYTPTDINFDGTDSFVFAVSDGNGGFDTSTTASITIVPVNDAPDVLGESLTVDLADNSFTGDDADAGFVEAGLILVDVLANDDDVDINSGGPGDTISLVNDPDVDNDAIGVVTGVLITRDSNGDVVDEDTDPTLPTVLSGNFAVGVAEDDPVILALEENQELVLTIPYTVTDNANNGDGTPEEVEGTLVFTFLGVNDPPVADPEEFTLDVNDGSFTEPVATLLDGDFDPEGTDITFDPNSIVTSGNATVTFNEDDTEFTYTPNAGFTGVDTFTYEISDEDGNVSVGTVTVTVFDPDAGLDNFSTVEDTAVTIAIADLIANDDQLGLTNPTFVSINTVSNGTAVRDGDDIIFTPAPNANDFLNPGEIGFSYNVSGDEGDAVANVLVSVTPVNDPAGDGAGNAVDVDVDAAEDGGPVATGVLAANAPVEIDGDVLTITMIDTDGTDAGINLVEISVGETVTIVGAEDIDGFAGDASAQTVGEVTLNADGTLSFSTVGFLQELGIEEEAEIILEYVVEDNPIGVDEEGEPLPATEATGTIDILVEGSNDAPVAENGNSDGDGAASDDAIEIAEGTVAVPSVETITVNADPMDVDGDDVVVGSAEVFITVGGVSTSLGFVDEGSLSGLDIDFNPSDFDAFNALDADESADGFIRYTVIDLNDDGDPIGGDDSADIFITINGADDELIANDDPDFTTDSDTPLDGEVLSNDFDDTSDTPLTVFSAGNELGDVTELGNGGSVTFLLTTLDAYSSEIAAGSVTINADGTFTFDPGSDFDDLEVDPVNGPETRAVSFFYFAENVPGDTDSAEVTITVSAVDSAPTGDDPTVTVFENGDSDEVANQTGPIEGALLVGITDPDEVAPVPGVDGDDNEVLTDNPGLTITSVFGQESLVGQAVQFNGGELTVEADGTVTFNSQGAFETLSGDDELSFTFPFTVTEFDQVFDENGDAVVGQDGDGDPVLVFEPGLSTEFTGTLVVDGENDAPVGVADSFLFGVPDDPSLEERTFNIPTSALLADDDDIDAGDVLSVEAVLNRSEALASAGLVFGDIDGDMPGDEGYSPEFFVQVVLMDDPAFIPETGEDPVSASFQYLLEDDGDPGLTDIVDVSLTFTAEGLALDDIVDGNGDDLTTPEDTPLTIEALANDVGGNEGGLEITMATVTGGDDVGTVVIDDSAGFDRLIFTPAENFNSPTVEIVYEVNDGADSATVTLAVTAVNDRPVAVNDTVDQNTDESLTVSEDGLLSFFDVLGNDDDVDASDTISVSQVNGIDATTDLTLPVTGGGEVTFEGSGEFTFSTAGDFQSLQVGDSVDVSFTYTITDDGTTNGEADPLTDSATVTITVTGLNDAPESFSDFADEAVDEGAPFDFASLDLSTAVTDVDNAIGELSVTNVTLVTSVGEGEDPGSFDETGLIFTPSGDEGFENLTFEVEISDPIGASDTALITLNVGQVNVAPGLMDFDFTVSEDDTRLIDLVDDLNGVDEDGEEVTITAINGTAIASEQTITLPSGATVTLTEGGDLLYDTNNAFDFLRDLSGPVEETFTDFFTVTGTDGELPVTVDVEALVTGVNDPPTAVADSATTAVGVPVTIDVLANDIDPDGGDPTIVGIGFSANTNGSVSVNPDGTVTYTPNAGFDGTATFTYTVSDGFSGGTDIGTVTVEVEPVNVAPPEVIAVRFGSQDFAAGFLDAVDPLGIGVIVAEDTGSGLAETVDSLPYINLDRLYVTFSEPVNGVDGAVELNGVDVPSYGLTLISVDGSTAEFAIDRTLTADRLNVVVDGTMVTDSSGDPGSLESIDVNVLPADVNSDTLVNVQDIALIGIGTASDYDPVLDINGTGIVTGTDVILANLLQFTSLPEASAATSLALAVAEAPSASEGLGALANGEEAEVEDESDTEIDEAFTELSSDDALLLVNDEGEDGEAESAELAEDNDEVDGADEAFAELAGVVDFSM